MNVIYLMIIVIAFCFKFVRCFVFNLHFVTFYTAKDIFEYFKKRKWRNFCEYGIDMYVGMFGHGKTLSMTHKARLLYKQYGDTLIFISNYDLLGIPYIPLINFQQLVDLGEKLPEGKQGVVVLIDEISSVLSHRNYASFPLELVSMLCQQRKRHIYIMCTAQRFFMVDKIWRSITTHVYDCSKFWRFQHVQKYDAWEYENAMNTQLIRKIGHNWWFVRDADYNSYDTSQMITKSNVKDFISNEESIVRKGLDAQVNELAVKNPSHKLKKFRKKGIG